MMNGPTSHTSGSQHNTSYGHIQENGTEGLQVGNAEDSFWCQMSLDDLRIAIQRLLKENNVLKNTMLENNATMEEQYELLQRWKDRTEQERSSIMRRFQQARTLIQDLQQQKQALEARSQGLSIGSPSVAGAINAEVQGLRLQVEELKRENALLGESKHLAESTNLQLSQELRGLQQERDAQHKSSMKSTGDTADINQIPVIAAMNDQQCHMQKLLESCMDHLKKMNPDEQSFQQINENLQKTSKDLDTAAVQLKADYAKVVENNVYCQNLIQEKENCIERMNTNNKMLQREKQQLTAMNNALETQLHVLRRNSPNKDDSASITLFDVTKAGLDTGKEQATKLEMASLPGEFVNVIKSTDEEREAVIAEHEHLTQRAATAGDAEGGQEMKKRAQHGKLEKTMSDLLMQLTEERAKLSSTQAQLHDKSSQLDKLKKELDSKDHMISDLKAKLSNTIDQLTLEHQLKVNQLVSKMDSMARELDQAKGQQLQIDDFSNMRSQVMSLVNELRETEKRCEGMGNALKAETERSSALQTKLSIFQEEKDQQRQKDDKLICDLRAAIQNLETGIGIERQEKDIHKKSLQELRKTYDRICSEYQDLLSNMERYKERQRHQASMPSKEVREKMDNLTAQLFAAEEALGSRNEKIRKLEQAVHTLKAENENIAVLTAQADVYKTDFEAERRNREEAMSSLTAIKEEIANLQRQNQQLRDELEASNHNQILEMQRQHAASFRPEMSARFPQMYPPPTLSPMQYPDTYRQAFPEPGPTYAEQMAQLETFDERLTARQLPIARQTGGTYQGYSRGMEAQNLPPARQEQLHAQATPEQRVVTGSPRPQNQEMMEEEDYTCPKCNSAYPDLDSLNLHVHRCLELDSLPSK